VKERVIGMMGNDGMMGSMGLWSILGLILMVAAVVAVAALIVWVVRRNSTSPSAGVPGEGQDAGEVLRRRFASGEIDEEEFQRRRAVLEGR
jgi:putative membrane protein